MSIKLAVAGRSLNELYDDVITLGSDPSCTVAFPGSSDVKPKHAVIRMIAGRWLVEAREGESVFVGSPEPKRLHWLVPGDVIRLTEHGPEITFQPPDDELSPRVPDVIVLPEDDPSPKVTMPASIGNPASSPKGQVANPPSSSTIRAVKPVEKSAQSKPVIPAAGSNPPPVAARIGEIINEDGAPVAEVRTLQRASSCEESSEPPGLTDEQREIRWIMMVVGRSVGAGIMLLLVWMTAGWIWKSPKPTPIDSLPVTPAVVDPQVNSPITTPPLADAVQSPTPSSDANRTRLPIVDQPKRPKPTREPTEPPPTAMSDTTLEPNTSDSTTSDKPDQEIKNPRHQKNSSGEGQSPSHSRQDSSSPTIHAVQESIYAVIMDSADKSRRIRLGTAWAKSRRYLVTTASIIAAIDEHQQQGMIASVTHFATGKTYFVKSKRVHESYNKALESSEEAREKRNDESFANERASQLRFDLGLLDIGRSERLPHRLAVDTEPLEDSNDTLFVMVGLPFQQGADDPAPETFDASSLIERRSKKPDPKVALQDKNMGLTIHFTLDSKGNNWSGSPVLNKDQKVIGVYAQLPTAKPVSGKPLKPMHGVVWIGRLHEFAPEADQ